MWRSATPITVRTVTGLVLERSTAAPTANIWTEELFESSWGHLVDLGTGRGAIDACCVVRAERPRAEVLNVGEMERPEPSAGEVLVRLATSGVNPSDVKSRLARPLAFPKIVPHSDGAGVIEAVGDGVDAVRIGERVWLWNGQWKRPSGTAAEYIALPERQAVPLADGIDFAAAACFGIPALTAWHAVASCGEINGKTVLVTGAASGVGHYAVQIARQKGARVIGTASGRRRGHAISAGCEAVIDYRGEPIVERLHGLKQLLDDGALSHAIGARFPLADTATAHEAVEKGDLIGNVIIDCS